MIARDGGCSFPGCDVKPNWCQAHHIVDYALGGPTSIDNGAMLCGFTHRGHARTGWSCRMLNGTPHWIPPGSHPPGSTPPKRRGATTPTNPYQHGTRDEGAGHHASDAPTCGARRSRGAALRPFAAGIGGCDPDEDRIVVPVETDLVTLGSTGVCHPGRASGRGPSTRSTWITA